MRKKAQEILEQLRKLETNAAHLAAESPRFRKVENKIMGAANAIDDWLSDNPEPAEPARPAKPAEPTKPAEPIKK